jgi:hypothetical protein
MFASRATRVQRARSAAIIVANAPGVLPIGAAPSAASLSRISLSARTVAAATCRRAPVVVGVPAGASSLHHCGAS